MSGPFPRDRFFVLSRFLTVPGPGEGPRRPKTSKNRPLQFFASPGSEGPSLPPPLPARGAGARDGVGLVVVPALPVAVGLGREDGQGAGANPDFFSSFFCKETSDVLICSIRLRL